MVWAIPTKGYLPSPGERAPQVEIRSTSEFSPCLLLGVMATDDQVSLRYHCAGPSSDLHPCVGLYKYRWYSHTVGMPKRKTRQETARDNREALLVAAQAMFERLGYHRASVDAMAEAASLSKGAVYSQFGSKDELFLAVIERNAAVRRDAIARVTQSTSEVDELLRLAYRQTSESLPWQAALIEFRVHAWRDEALSRRYAELHRRTIDGMTRLIEEFHERTATDPARPPIELARVGVMVSAGLVVELLTDPTLDIESAVEATTRFAIPRPTTGETK